MNLYFRMLIVFVKIWCIFHFAWIIITSLLVVTASFAATAFYLLRKAYEQRIECGYLGYSEIINIIKVKSSAIWSALSYLLNKEIWN